MKILGTLAGFGMALLSSIVGLWILIYFLTLGEVNLFLLLWS
jgi:hypothetical protein